MGAPRKTIGRRKEGDYRAGAVAVKHRKKVVAAMSWRFDVAALAAYLFSEAFDLKPTSAL
jgi:hypothetical protein